jgi:hypothetical protein
MILPQENNNHIPLLSPFFMPHIILSPVRNTPDVIQNPFLPKPGILPFPFESGIPDNTCEKCTEIEISSKTDIGKSEKPKYELADIFRIYGEEFRKKNKVSNQQADVMYAIENCRTGAFGYHIDICDTCGHIERVMNSCRNRHCPTCQGNKRIMWVNKRIDELLPVGYFHNVFTLPDKIFPMCLYNQKVIYDLLFHSVAETLHAFAADPKWLGAVIGFFAVLHTWGQLMPMHPHLHVVIPAGGLNEAGEWVDPKYEKNNFMFPVRGLSKVFRGKFIEGLKKAYKNGELNFPGELEELSEKKNFNKWLNQLTSNEWVVYSKAPFGGPEDVVRYVGRYTHRVAISNSRIISIDNGIIRFTYKNYRNKDKVENYEELWEETEMSSDEFIRRFLFHVVPAGYHRIRHFGFLGNSKKCQRQQAWEELVMEKERGLAEERESDYEGIGCPICKMGKMNSKVVINGYGRIVHGSFIELWKEKEQIESMKEWVYSDEMVTSWNSS